MIKKTKTSVVSDLKLLIDISCLDFERLGSFAEFHRLLIRMAYKATDVKIDHSRNKIHMKVLSEDETFDLVAIDQFADEIAVTLSYDEIDEFLKSCLLVSTEVLKHYFPFLISGFNKTKNKVQVLESI